MSRSLRRAARTVALHPGAAAALATLGVDVNAILAEPAELQPKPPRPAVNPHQDGPEDVRPYRRDYRNFERDRS